MLSIRKYKQYNIMPSRFYFEYSVKKHLICGKINQPIIIHTLTLRDFNTLKYKKASSFLITLPRKNNVFVQLRVVDILKLMGI